MIDREQSHLFTLRLWLEEPENGPEVIRGVARHALSGNSRPIRGWANLQEFLIEQLRSGGHTDSAGSQPDQNLDNEEDTC